MHMRATPGLRFVRRPTGRVAGDFRLILQQYWIPDDGSRGEWRDVETTNEEPQINPILELERGYD